MAQSTYKAKGKQAQQPQLVLGLFAQQDGQPFSLVDPLTLATAAVMLRYNHLVAGTFGNNLACLRCGRCSLGVSFENMDEAVSECFKCSRKERFEFAAAYQFYLTMQPEKVRRAHAQEMNGEWDGTSGESVKTRIDLPMLSLPMAVAV